MKFLCTGDWHIDTNKPERRTDDYWKTVQNKLSFILHLAVEEKAVILQPGDFFNTHKANDFLKRYIIHRLRSLDLTVLTVFGQHDLRYHSSDVKNTPLGVLQAADVACVLDFDPIEYKDVSVYGTSWYEDVPKPVDSKIVNILVTHKMIVKNEKVWEGQEDATMGNIFLKGSGYDLIVSGDNHQHFTITTRSGKHLVNCGSLLRTAIDQSDHVPMVYIYGTKANTLTPYEVPHEPFTKVFDMKKYEEEKVKDEKMEAFFERLNGEVELEGLDFIVNMDTFVKENDEEIDDLTLDIIEEVMS